MSFWKMIDSLADAVLNVIEGEPTLEYMTRFGMDDAAFKEAMSDAQSKKYAKPSDGGKKRVKPRTAGGEG